MTLNPSQVTVDHGAVDTTPPSKVYGDKVKSKDKDKDKDKYKIAVTKASHQVTDLRLSGIDAEAATLEFTSPGGKHQETKLTIFPSPSLSNQ